MKMQNDKSEKDFLVSRILVVEDDRGLNRIICKKLKNAGYKAIGVYSGQNAIEAVTENRNMLMLLDYKLSDLTGKEVIGTLKARDIIVPFMIITGFGDEKTAVTMMKMGALEYIVKEENFLDILPQLVGQVIEDIALKRKSDEMRLELERNGERFKQFFNNVPEYCYMISPDGLIIDANKHALDGLGYEKTDLAGKPLRKLYAPESNAKMEEIYIRWRETGRINDVEMTIVTKSGEKRTVLLSADTVKDVNGHAIHSILIQRDITERKRIDEALRKSEEKLRSLVENAPNIIMLVDREGKIEFINHVVAGLRKEDVIGANQYDYVSPEYRDIVRQKIESVFETGISARYETEGMGPDGRYSWYETQVGAVKDNNRVVSALLIISDVTERMQAERTVRENEKKMKNISQNMPVLMDAFDENGNIIAWNQECERVSGYSAEEIIGNPHALEKLYPDKAYFDQLMSEWNSRGNSFRNWETIITAKDGTRKNILWSNISDEFQIPGWASWSVGLDITDFRQLELQLSHAQKLEAIGQLAGGVAHEFNNLLGGILGYADLLKLKLNSSPKLNTYVQKIIKSATFAANLTRELLTFARKARVEIKPVDVHKCIDQTISMLQHTIDRNISIHKELHADFSIVEADDTQIENALLNLGINARDAMPKGGILTFGTETVILDSNSFPNECFEVIPGKYVKIYVIDTGTGMDKNAKEHLFEPFFTTKELGKGTGLGLAAVYGFVKQHNGYILVKSRKKRGTTFEIYLHASVKKDKQPVRVETGDLIKGTGSILVVDDEEDMLESTAEMLETLGYETVCCSNGLEATEYYSKNQDKVDAVILDLVMPEMGGLECFRQLKKINPNVAVIVSTGQSGNGEETIIQHEGIMALIQKPFFMSRLSCVVADVLDRRK